jgi:hypothetical protein
VRPTTDTDALFPMVPRATHLTWAMGSPATVPDDQQRADRANTDVRAA